jgi:ribosomal protein S18 acetylase RimI-like enzyme
MRGSMTIRPAAPADADEIADLVRESFRPGDLGLTIYGCAGIAAYLRMEFALPRAFSASTYLVAAIEDRLAGFVELRAVDNGVCLNYIATSREWQRAGVARDLLAAALREADPVTGSELTLEVFEHNEAALGWYRRSGFRRQGRTAFWRVLPGNGGAEGPVRITGLPQADVVHRVFGFSQFNLSHGGRTFAVGRLGESWFRVTDGGLLNYPEALCALRSLDSRREILLAGAEEAIPRAVREGCSPILWSIRMGRQL